MTKESGIDAVSSATRWMIDETCPVDPSIPYPGYDAAPPMPVDEPPKLRPAGASSHEMEKTSRPQGSDDAEAGVDATTGATPGVDAATGATPGATSDEKEKASEPQGSDDEKASDDAEEGVDAATGATPGVSAACRELDLSSVDEVVASLGINPPGVA